MYMYVHVCTVDGLIRTSWYVHVCTVEGYGHLGMHMYVLWRGSLRSSVT